MFFKIICLLSVLVTFCNGATVLAFTGKGYITQNKTFLLTESAGYTVQVTNGWYPNGGKSEIAFSFDNFSSAGNTSWWRAVFAAPEGETLVSGKEYLGAVRYPFAETRQSSMDISGDGRGSNQVLGSFTILELTWTPDNQVATAAVDFLHFTEGNSEQCTQGSLRYNSDIPVSPIPEPTTPILCLLGLGFVVRRKR